MEGAKGGVQKGKTALEGWAGRTALVLGDGAGVERGKGIMGGLEGKEESSFFLCPDGSLSM